MRKWIPLFAAFMLFMSVAASPAAAEGTSSPSQGGSGGAALRTQVRLWIGGLAEQPEFAAWKTAEPVIAPLGPGTHCWLVTLRADRKPVGYMIINATPEGGFELGEYGVGSHPAFDPNTLYLSLVRQGLFDSYSDALKKPLRLERLYVHPLLAVWKYDAEDGQTVYMDAWTGEALPIDDDIWQRQLSLQPSSAQVASGPAAAGPTAVADSHLNEPFDPYETMPWLTGLPLDEAKLTGLPQLLDKGEKIRFTAQLYDSTVLFVWPAVGYHRWNDGTEYIAFDQYGTRFVPLRTIAGSGGFYR